MIQELPWLPVPPQDFRQRRLALKRRMNGSARSGLWDELRGLASYALEEAQLTQLASLVGELGPSEAPAALKLAVIGDGTLSLLGPPIVASALRSDLRLQIVEGDYGSSINEAINPGSIIHSAKPDFILIACNRHGLGLGRLQLTENEAKAQIESAFVRIQTMVEGLRPSTKRAILVQTVAPPMAPLFGSYDAVTLSSPHAQVAALNARLATWALKGDIVLVDIARLASTVGLERWEDASQWHASKLPFAFSMIPLYADVVARTVGAVLGKSRKCLVLDLDNTLWGGVIGDDGVGGIALGQGSAAGEAFLAVQEMALNLRSRGVVLAVCSKNEDDAARLPFRQHSEMVLSEDHIAVFQANWIDKAANLKVIAQTLNIGLDALVFLDDNPAEREQVRRELPMVAVPELPESPAFYPDVMQAAGYFEAISFENEDRARAADYQAGAARAALQASASNLDEYLKSLSMVCTLKPFDADGRARIAQLINKSNQFNLTTRRYTEREVAELSSDPTKYTLQVQLVDRFGNNGMICVLVADIGSQEWTIDVWLMSCRVLGRRVEEAALANVAAAARAAGAEYLVGRYIPSAKNRMVADHYGKLGFIQVKETQDGCTTWKLALASYGEPNLPMRIVTGDAVPLAL
jgi:FkbH-like protein